MDDPGNAAHKRHSVAVWDVIMAYTGVINDAEMREELEDSRSVRCQRLKGAAGTGRG